MQLSSFQLDNQYVDQILKKSNEVQSKMNEIEDQSSDDFQNYSNMINSFQKFCKNFGKNISFFGDSSFFQEDFKKNFLLINSFFDYYLKSTEIQNDIKLFSRIFGIFYVNFKKSISKMKDKKISKLDTKLIGLHSVLFNLSVKIEPKEQAPFYTSQFLRIYKCYDSIINFERTIAAFKSVGGSGKSVCIPIMILCRFLEENMDTSFLLMTEPNREIVEEKTAFFRSNIGHYVNVTDDVNNLIASYNDTENKKYVFGILTPEELLFVIQNQNKKSDFFRATRILIDEVNEQSIYTDVLLVLMKNYKEEFQLPLTFSMMSATIKKNHRYIQFFEDEELNVTKLVHKPLFKVTKRSITNDKIQAITDETSHVIEEMAKKNSKIEEGHLICFIQGIESAQILKSSIISHFQEFEIKEDMKNIVIMKTILKPNESADSYFNRLRNEYEIAKGMNEVDDDQCLYFVIIDLIDQSDISKIKLAQNNFPEDLNQINKIICSLYSIDSLAIDKLSVVIDFCLSKVWFFNCDIGFYASNVIRSSKQSMDRKKGLLGRTMNGLYVSFFKQDKYLTKQILDETEPSVVHDDLTQGILNLKDMNIDFEKLTLPTNPNLKNLEYSLNKLKEINAIDEKLKITPYGRQIVKIQRGKNSIISIYYANAILKFSEKFSSVKQYAQLFGFYLALLISMAMNLIQESNAEKLISVFSKDSDVETLVNASRILLSSDLVDNDELRNFVESYGFSYSTFLTFRSILQKEANVIFNKEGVKISKEIDTFVKICADLKLDIFEIINRFIQSISSDKNWLDIHTIDLDYITESNGVITRPTLAFNGNPNLAIWNNNEKKYPSEIRVTQRPGWNGISIPAKCICLDICIYYNRWMSYGNILHKFSEQAKNDIISLELPKIASNPWFIVLINTYFSKGKLNVRCLKHVFNYNKKHFEEIPYYISNTIEQSYLSFIPLDEKAISVIQNGINACLKLMPFVPRSILIYRSDPRALIEIMSDGTQNYNSFISTQSTGDKLKRKHIDYCIKNINKLATIDPEIRICAVFFDKECLVDDYNARRLYFVTSLDHFDNLPKIIKVIEKQRKPRHVIKKRNLSRSISRYRKGVAYFIFPPKIIHPALLYHNESFKCICKWFSKCDYVKLLRVVDHNHFLMPIKCIKELQKHIRNEKDLIIEQIGLKYVAIPIPNIVYEKAHMIIREHQNWIYNNRFKVVIATKEEEKDIKDLIKKIADEIQDENPSAQDNHDLLTETLGCCYICDDPDNPTLTTYPITIYFKNRNAYTNKICRDCLVLNIQNIVNSFYNDETINQNALDLISAKPQPIPIVDLSETKGGNENWPKIPLGQLISIIINNDDELSALVSAWLNSVQEFTIRNLAKDQFTFCPDHPKKIFKINNDPEADQIMCKHCHNVFCIACLGWHKKDFICDELKSGKNFNWKKKCPKCHKPTIKDGGCNHISCPCGCHWCYVCGKGFNTPDQCYNHMRSQHGDIY